MSEFSTGRLGALLLIALAFTSHSACVPIRPETTSLKRDQGPLHERELIGTLPALLSLQKNGLFADQPRQKKTTVCLEMRHQRQRASILLETKLAFATWLHAISPQEANSWEQLAFVVSDSCSGEQVSHAVIVEIPDIDTLATHRFARHFADRPRVDCGHTEPNTCRAQPFLKGIARPAQVEVNQRQNRLVLKEAALISLSPHVLWLGLNEEPQLAKQSPTFAAAYESLLSQKRPNHTSLMRLNAFLTAQKAVSSGDLAVQSFQEAYENKSGVNITPYSNAYTAEMGFYAQLLPLVGRLFAVSRPQENKARLYLSQKERDLAIIKAIHIKQHTSPYLRTAHIARGLSAPD